MKTRTYIFITAILLSFGFGYYKTLEWNIDYERSSVTFRTRNAKGSIGGLKAEIIFDKNDLENASLSGSADVKTVDLGIGVKSLHAQTKSWLDAETYPTITYKSDDISFIKDNFYKTTGTLNLKGVSKEISFPFKFDENGTNATFTGSFTINRKDYNVNAIGTGDEITVNIEVPAAL